MMPTEVEFAPGTVCDILDGVGDVVTVVDERDFDEAVSARVRADLRRGRGARSNVVGRYEPETRTDFDDGWDSLRDLGPWRTTVYSETAKSIISSNNSPDLAFDQSINPYRGCEHGCIYCYARPTHAYLGHSPGLDFETLLYAKTNAAELLETALAKPGYVPKILALGAVTDPYQPVEREKKISREVLRVLERAGHPVGIVTKSAGIVRDLDILSAMAARRLVKVAISVTTLDAGLARSMEPRAATPARRLDAIRKLSDAGIPVTVLVAPIVPGLNDSEIEAILRAAREAGARHAGYVLLRLPLELKSLFREWLETDFPDRASRVISLLRSMHGGRDYVAEFGHRQRGSGPFAEQIAARFRLALKRLDMNTQMIRLRTDLFQPPVPQNGQYRLL
ncbi:MAG: PA0069 family radical SAM protein [Hyphomicrobiaceae bacterium]